MDEDRDVERAPHSLGNVPLDGLIMVFARMIPGLIHNVLY